MFDKLLMGKLDRDKITFAVRSGPTQNDATRNDVEYTGLTMLVRVIDIGAAIPGVVLEFCSDEFRKVYAAVDLIISKGQGNFETFDHTDSRIFFVQGKVSGCCSLCRMQAR